MSNAYSLFQPRSDAADDATVIAEAIRCIDDFTDRFNARDLAGLDALLHFPHIILSGERVVIWEQAGQLPASFFDDLARTTGWAKSTYQRKDPVLVSSRKVHLLVEYTRDRADGSIASHHRNLWIVTSEGGRWGIKQRSY
ncbi:hypothetical protein MTX26_33795 [Bradyrhizobium sp. ISRA443]|uniref:hypothetical protein n=1 Tax=unclassified Bradyrhizobium TaxID=2631580 RepID=UPI0024785965|nr:MULTISPECIES: hypothetical protein [unclassified Bradyrhizobium]WGR94382.1 hypothetical protein MTX20_08895 [Bradyrhizobium sp. ISRA435]WGR99100.1 hypothetical protein MTX23_33775 [Bradyrhizobium sp. ISRA436]WGS05991.1 hypothetical protein MTX18_33795 [Bradyrhizobium sp. ISRA437]WGS12877.1 hypothetical protein MTX26_33795 [Bradyrhizobium sp. ISRA443]